MTDDEILELHRQLVAIPSVSHEEQAIADWCEGWLRDRGASVQRVGNNVVATAGAGPRLLLNSHLDTVPPSSRWTRAPWTVTREEGRVYGLGANDAKAAVTAMTATFLAVQERGGPCQVALMLVCEEETGGEGTELAWPTLRQQGFEPEAVVVGEPTGLAVATSQKGLLILELSAEGDACHSANAAFLEGGVRNAIREIAGDLVRLVDIDLGPAHPQLGATTMEPTVLRAGEARNMVPDRATCWLDLRTVPGVSHDELVERVQAALAGHVRVHSKRLVPRACPADARILEALKRSRPGADFYGSRTMSDLVYFADVPAVKVGPGQTERSHTPDEFVLESEVLDGVRFYLDLVEAFGR